MWELFQTIFKNNLTPNQAVILFGMKLKIGMPNILKGDKDALVKEGYVTIESDTYKLTPKAKTFIAHLDNYFIKAKKKTNNQVMGKDFVDRINTYRETFPNQKLPSGKPARVNVKMLSESFRWFFSIRRHYRSLVVIVALDSQESGLAKVDDALAKVSAF